ncbi:MAG: hypothetical protein ABFD97_24540 [Syntrophobacter sp.]
MYSDFVLIDGDSTEPIRVERLAFGDTSGRNEAWLRDTLLAHSGLLPVREIDASFGQLIPLCRELRTEAGPIDAAFINGHGRLTLVECKLWRNPEARRKVVAQVLDYARAVSRWSYSDLQRQVAIATGRKGNAPFEIVRERHPEIKEQSFVDQVGLGMRQGRFLLIIAGDGIREDVAAIAELINRNATLGFAFALVEVALYGMPGGELLVQPRVAARSQVIERSVIVLRNGSQADVVIADEADDTAVSAADDQTINDLGEGPRQAAYRRWWQPVMDAPLDDPDQEPPRLFWPNHIRAALPWKNAWISCYTFGGESGKMGVGTAGRMGADQEMLKSLQLYRDEILAALPPGSEYRPVYSGKGHTFINERAMSEFPDDDKRREWIAKTLNEFVNVLRPRITQLIRTAVTAP